MRTRPPHLLPHRSVPRAATVLGLAAAVVVLAGACAPTPPPTTEPSTPPTTSTPPDVGEPTDRLPNDWGAELFEPDLVDLAYDPEGPYPERLADLYLPVAGGNRGVIVHVHGGGFVEGARSDVERYTGPLLRQLERGFSILTIDYRFEAFPAAVLDLDAAVRFVRSAPAVELGVVADTVLVSGHSAGATVAADLALAADRGDAEPFGRLSEVDGWLSVSALTDLHTSYRGEPPAATGWAALDEPAASPLVHLDPEDPPGLVIHGVDDGIVYVEHAWALQDRALELDVTQVLFDLVDDGPEECRHHLPMCGASIAGIDAFVDGVAGVSAPQV